MSQEPLIEKTHKIKGITYFAIGILVGIIFCVTFMLMERYFLGNRIHLSQKVVELEQNEDIKWPLHHHEAKTNEEQEKAPSTSDTSAIISDSTVVDEQLNDEDNFDSGDFAFDSDEFIDEETIIDNKLLKTRTVKVDAKIVKNGILEELHSSSDKYIQHFEVEQWESPFKNRISYQREENLLRIKGMDISTISITFINGNYYIEDGKHFYSIVNQKNFVRLSVIDPLLH